LCRDAGRAGAVSIFAIFAEDAPPWALIPFGLIVFEGLPG
jgi:hypothetical protein